MINLIRFLTLAVLTLSLSLTQAITNQELTIITNSIAKNQRLTLNAELSNAYLNKDLEKAMYYAQETLKEALLKNSLIGIPFAHQQIGKVHLKQGDLLEALEQFLIAQEKYKATQNWVEIALNNILIGDVYANTGDLLRAENEFNKCKEIGEKINNNTLISTGFLALFDIETNQKNPAASAILKKATYFIGQIESKDLKAAFYSFIGHRKQNTYNYNEAVFFYKKSIVLSQLTNNIEALVETYYKAGKVKEKLKLFTEAKAYYVNGFEAAKNNSYLLGIKIGCLKLSTFYEARGDYKNSSIYLKYLNKIKTLQGEAELKARIELADQEKQLFIEKEQSKNDLKFKNTFLILLSIITGVLVLFLALLFYAFRTKSSFLRKLEISNKKIISIQKEKDDFLAYTSHEIRTPLSAVVGSAELLESTPLTKPQQKHLSSLKISASNILFLVNDILDLSKLEKRKITLENISFSLTELIENVFIALDPKAVKNNVQLRKNITTGVPETVVGDPVRLNQVLVNLIDNAIKFSKDGIVSLSLNINSNTSNKTLTFEIKDTGTGIEAEKLNTIFSPYAQETKATSRQYGGTGLGLSICKNIIEIMHGEISVSSTIGIGSLFTFTIPYSVSQQNSKPALESLDIDLDKITILLVEDDLLNGELYSSLLKNRTNNITVDWAENGQEALDFLLKKANYDIIIMDLEMPIKNGFETTKEIRNKPNLKAVPILGMTAHVVEDVLAKCIKSGMNDCISKPFQAKQLKNKIKELLFNSHSEESLVFDNLTLKNDEKKAKYISIFESSFRKDLLELKKAIVSNDLQLCHNQLHKMKGSCLTLGITELSDLLIKMEQKKSLDLNEDLIVLKELFKGKINLLKEINA
jgi:signal transduction histidine kinase/DNA-binding NarL/FixJ family response regulator